MKAEIQANPYFLTEYMYELKPLTISETGGLKTSLTGLKHNFWLNKSLIVHRISAKYPSILSVLLKCYLMAAVLVLILAEVFSITTIFSWRTGRLN
jgi:hypothetical protein